MLFSRNYQETKQKKKITEKTEFLKYCLSFLRWCFKIVSCGGGVINCCRHRRERGEEWKRGRGNRGKKTVSCVCQRNKKKKTKEWRKFKTLKLVSGSRHNSYIQSFIVICVFRLRDTPKWKQMLTLD